MAEYRRFVAYVYEYQKGKKANNCGFIKVEAKDGKCRMEVHLQCPGLTPDMNCSIYGFIRKKGMLRGIWIGQCKTLENIVEGKAETEVDRIGGSQFTLGDLSGVILKTDSGAFFGTEWDDEAIRPETFEVMSADEETRQERPMEKTAPQEDFSQDLLPETVPLEEKTEEESIPKAEQEQPAFEKDEEDLEIKETKRIPKEPSIMFSQEVEAVKEENKTLAPNKKWPGEACELFDDGEILTCWKIQLQDFKHFHKRDWVLRNNRFLLYGYYNFGHILLCRKADGSYLLGVPGGYDQQERFMAGMFGFPCFKESRTIRLKKGKGGYWYRSINPPDFHQRDGIQEDRAKMP